MRVIPFAVHYWASQGCALLGHSAFVFRDFYEIELKEFLLSLVH